jgi:hypothetical protein
LCNTQSAAAKTPLLNSSDPTASALANDLDNDLDNDLASDPISDLLTFCIDTSNPTDLIPVIPLNLARIVCVLTQIVPPTSKLSYSCRSAKDQLTTVITERTCYD